MDSLVISGLETKHQSQALQNLGGHRPGCVSGRTKPPGGQGKGLLSAEGTELDKNIFLDCQSLPRKTEREIQS